MAEEAANYRVISILSIHGKICGRVFISRVVESTKEQVAEKKGGFRSGICIDQLFLLKQVIEKHKEKIKEVYVPFMDLEKAYNKVYRKVLWRSLHEREVDGYLIRNMSSLYNGSKGGK